ncbi:MAG: hypothetical protein JWN24_101 [Phycisphaerales bacterium]|nr:hypothetical protein [Phycisphaerales bacterium]
MGPNFSRTLLPVGLAVTAVEGQPLASAKLATFTDTNNAAGSVTHASDYVASVSWGDGNFVSTNVSVAADTDPADPGGFVVTASGTVTNPDALIVTEVQYAPGSSYPGRPASLGEPVVSVTPAVSDLSAVAISTSEIDLSWTVNATNASAIEVDTSTDGVTYTATMLDPTATSYQDTGLSEGSHHYYKVRAIQPVGPSAFAGPVDLYVIPMVSNLTADPVSTSEIDLAWDAVSSPGATGIEVWRSSDGITYSLLTTLSPGATGYADTGLMEATAYEYEVRVIEGTAASDFSTFPVATLPGSPTGVTASPSGADVTISWTASPEDLIGYQILGSTDGTTFTYIASVDASTTSFDDWTALDGTRDYYEVCAQGLSGTSAPSAIVSATPIPPIQVGDATPANGVNYQILHGQSLTINWADLLAKDTDLNENAAMTMATFSQPSHGTLIPNPDGTFTYAADASFTGQDTFTYTATDQYNASSNTGTVDINVTDQMPEAYSQLLYMPQAVDASGNYTLSPGPVSGNLIAYDPDGDPLTYTVVSGPTSGQGTFTLDPDTGAFTFTPNPNNAATVTVVFKANDKALDSNLATLTFPGFTVDAHEEDDEEETAVDGDEFVYDPVPAAGANQHLGVDQNGTLQVGAPGLLAGASDGDTVTPDPDSPSVDTTLIEPPTHGTLSALNGTDGSYTYQPNPGFVGRDYFTYRILDGSKVGGYATTFIDVQPVAVSLSIDYLQPGDASAVIPAPDPLADTPPYATVNLSYPGPPDGSTITFSVNSDVGQDLNVYSDVPGTSGSTALIGKDAGTNSVTWTVGGSGSNAPLSTVYATGVAGTDYDQVTFTLSVAVAPQQFDTPADPATKPANDPVDAKQPATVPKQHLVAMDGSLDGKNDGSIVSRFVNAYDDPSLEYIDGVASKKGQGKAGQAIENIDPKEKEETAKAEIALSGIEAYYSNPKHENVPLDLVGYSRGAMEVVWIIDRLETDQKIVLKGGSKDDKKSFFDLSRVRFVGLIAPVLGPKGTKDNPTWPTSVPDGVEAAYQALAGKDIGNTPAGTLKEIALAHLAVQTEIDISKCKLKLTEKFNEDDHITISKDDHVLTNMKTQAKKAGVEFKN